MSIESVMPSSHLILCCPLLLLPAIPPSITVFSSESILRMRWPKLPLYFRMNASVEKAKNNPLISNKIKNTDPGALVVSTQEFQEGVGLILCNPMNCSMPGLPVHHQLPEFTHRVIDAIQSSHPLSSPSPPAPNPSQHHSLFQ